VADAEPMTAEPARHPGTVQLLRWFDYQHLPADLGVVSMQFHHLAHELVDRLPDSPELTVALRKLLEGKDAAVRAALAAGGIAADRSDRVLVTELVHNRVDQELTVLLRIPDGLPPEVMGAQVAAEVAAKLERSAPEQFPRS
jgi:gamma-glutamyl:cysteine ligase YbdK (ATP-grasp superfamily)